MVRRREPCAVRQQGGRPPCCTTATCWCVRIRRRHASYNRGAWQAALHEERAALVPVARVDELGRAQLCVRGCGGHSSDRCDCANQQATQHGWTNLPRAARGGS
eukprot:2630736-Prymnesium_polylepis.1